jgi:lipopolysaccharide transport system ATP-binding protein
MSSKTLLEVQSLSKRFCRDPRLAVGYAMRDIFNDLRARPGRDYLRPGEFWAVHNVDLHVEAGEVLGIIGHNGAGKSTLINLLAGILRPTVGTVTLYTDRVILMDHQGGMSPYQTGRENVGNQLSLYGMEKDNIDACLDEVIAYSDLGDFIDAPVGTYSLGMRVRLAFAIYSRLKPDLFIVDEALNGGDLKFRMKFQRFLNDYIEGGGSILLASHDLFTIQSMCRRCVLMEGGEVHSIGEPEKIVYSYAELADEKLNDMLTIEPRAGASAEDKRTLPASEVLELVEFESVEISSPDGGPLVPSGPAIIRIACNSLEAVSRVVIGLEFGVNGVFPVATITGGYGDGGCGLAEGANEFSCCIDSLPLLPGNHLLCVGIVKRDGGALLGFKGYEDAPVRFEVVGKPDQAMNMSLFRKNLVYIPSRWRTHNADSRIGAS